VQIKQAAKKKSSRFGFRAGFMGRGILLQGNWQFPIQRQCPRSGLTQGPSFEVICFANQLLFYIGEGEASFGST
jgi:hypothetical protein